MHRYVAFLRGVSPLNAKMPALKRCFESAGFTNVRTLLGSGNVVFDARKTTPAALERRAEQAMAELPTAFVAIVRSSEFLQALIAADPFAAHGLPGDAKRVVTFLKHAPRVELALPLERDGACVLRLDDRELLSYYTPSPKGPVFMQLIERTFGRDLTTRTWDTVKKCAAA